MADSGEAGIVAPMQVLGLACLDPPLWLPLVAEFFPLRHISRFSSLHFTPSDVINISVANFPLTLTWVASTEKVMICSTCGSAPRQARPKARLQTLWQLTSRFSKGLDAHPHRPHRSFALQYSLFKSCLASRVHLSMSICGERH